MWGGTPGHRILPKQYVLLALLACTHVCHGCRPAQTLQDRAKQLEASTSTSAAATDATMADLCIQLEAERAEARRAKMEASSTAKQYEALVARLRREADASECGGQQCRQRRRVAVADGSGCWLLHSLQLCVAVVWRDSLCLLSSCVSCGRCRGGLPLARLAAECCWRCLPARQAKSFSRARVAAHPPRADAAPQVRTCPKLIEAGTCVHMQESQADPAVLAGPCMPYPATCRQQKPRCSRWRRCSSKQ